MSITNSIPYMSSAFCMEFMARPREITKVVKTDTGPKLVTEPNPRYWVSDDAMDRAHRIMAEKDAQFLRVLARGGKR